MTNLVHSLHIIKAHQLQNQPIIKIKNDDDLVNKKRTEFISSPYCFHRPTSSVHNKS
jgi:hypothetical protein